MTSIRQHTLDGLRSIYEGAKDGLPPLGPGEDDSSPSDKLSREEFGICYRLDAFLKQEERGAPVVSGYTIISIISGYYTDFYVYLEEYEGADGDIDAQDTSRSGVWGAVGSFSDWLRLNWLSHAINVLEDVTDAEFDSWINVWINSRRI